MNLILLFEADFLSSHRVRLQGRRAQHVLAVHRAAPGDVLRVGRINGLVGEGTVVEANTQGIVLEIDLNRAPPPPLALTLLLALPRPKSLKKVLQAVAAMGVKKIILINTWRVEKSFWDSPLLQGPLLAENLQLGLEQGCDTILPSVTLERRFKPFVEDRLSTLIDATRALVAHPSAILECPRGVDTAITLAIGPEGGFIPYEVERFVEYGFEAVTLGVRPLRVENAVPALIGRLL